MRVQFITSLVGFCWLICLKETHFSNADKNECQLQALPCGPNAMCFDTAIHFSCICLPGYNSSRGNAFLPSSVAPLNCSDIDECSQDPSPCGLNSICNNTPGSYTCRCRAGYFPPSQSDGRFSCTDIDECSQDPSPCGLNSICNNTLGSYTCTCRAGYLSPSQPDTPFNCTDIDECSHNPSPCGPNSICSNTLGNYTCTCQAGYLSPSQPGAPFNCTDIEECSQDPSLCGPNSICINTLGSYTCICQPGYLPPSQPGAPFNCTDIDECSRDPSPCGLNSICSNTLGSYTCRCRAGYLSPSQPGAPFNCTDIDKCSHYPSFCGPTSICNSTLGSYTWTCRAGYVPPSQPGTPFSCTGVCWLVCFAGTQHFSSADIGNCPQDSSPCGKNSTCNNVLGNYTCMCRSGYFLCSKPDVPLQCVDIDECSQNPSICGLRSFCVNTPGSHSCRCKAGHSSPGGNSWKPGDNHTLNCTENVSDQFKSLTGVNLESRCNTSQNGNQKSNTFCTLMKDILKTQSSAFGNGSNPVSLQKATASFDSFVGNISELPPKEKVLAATVFLKSVESVAFEAALTSPMNQIKPNKNETMTIAAKAVKDNCSIQGESISLNAKNESMAIYCTTVVGSDSSGTGAVVFIVYDKLESLLKDSVSNQSLTGPEGLGDVTLNSNIVIGTIGESRNLSRPFNFTLEHKQLKNNKETVCVFWDVVGNKSTWSKEGCNLLSANNTHTTCACNHMSSFAVLMARHVSQQEDGALSIITYVGLSISLLCLFLAILTFLLCRSIRNVSTSIHLQLCLCLFVADLLFVTGMDTVKDKVGCAVIAGLLHYLFLACFTWMFLEGLHLFLTVRNLKVVNYTRASQFKKRYMYPFGYGFPALIVAISAAVHSEGYKNSQRCWLKTEKGFLWSFLGPVCLIVLMNCTFFITTLWILRDKICSLNSDVSTVKNTRLLTFKAIAQLFILGCTWSFGFLQVGQAATFMAYLFTIVNSLQGAFIFLVHCLLNHQVRAEYKKWIQRIEKPSTRTTTLEISMSAAPLSTGIVEWDKSS
ncbi:adhesion G protein-coupled receptor E1-like [Pelodiscus sinensis]|uniref:adhesion G protein-coupled receptor E1-like n=1 Tax=Pelodiscus sinensis TaxID=13735 RepID=UPI003F6C1909